MIYFINDFLVTIAIINILSARVATKVQIVFTASKITAISIMIGIGVYNMVRGEFGALSGGFDKSDAGVGVIATSFYSGLWVNENKFYS